MTGWDALMQWLADVIAQEEAMEKIRAAHQDDTPNQRRLPQ